MREMYIGDENFERRVSAYLEMEPVILVAALNVHFKGRTAFSQTKFFDLSCLTEALLRSDIDISELSVINADKISLNGPFKLVDSNKIIREEE